MKKEKPKGKGNKTKIFNISFSLFSLIMLIALALGVNAEISCNITSPAAGGTLSHLTQMNVSYNISQSTGNMTVAVQAKSSSTANSSYSLLFNRTNSSNIATGNQFFNHTLNLSMILEDASTYTFRAFCYVNISNSATTADAATRQTGASSEVTPVTIDRSAPLVPTSPSPSGRVTNGSDFTFSASVNGANVTSCTLRFIGKNPGSSAYATTHSGNLCSLAFTNLPKGIFEYTLEATDGLNTSVPTAITQLEIDKRTSTAKKAYIASGGQLPQQASATAQQRASGQQGLLSIDGVIAKAPPEAQAGLTKAKESVTKQYKGFEAVKTWSGTAIGCGAGMLGLTLGPVGLVTIPAGCIGGHILGAIV